MVFFRGTDKTSHSGIKKLKKFATLFNRKKTNGQFFLYKKMGAFCINGWINMWLLILTAQSHFNFIVWNLTTQSNPHVKALFWSWSHNFFTLAHCCQLYNNHLLRHSDPKNPSKSFSLSQVSRGPRLHRRQIPSHCSGNLFLPAPFFFIKANIFISFFFVCGCGFAVGWVRLLCIGEKVWLDGWWIWLWALGFSFTH